MKKMIRIVSALLLMLLIVPAGVRADVIYEPWDSFYEEHRNVCEYHARSYTAAGPNGDVTVYESPESDWVETKLPNGSVLWISYTYKDAEGIVWGCWESWEEDILGWVPMDYLELIYDGISFEEEYGDAFEEVSGSLDATELTGQTVYFWEYPGSGTYIDVELDAEYRPEFRTSYTDANGIVWVQCDYYMGIRNYWINLNDPTAGNAEAIIPVPDETEGPAIPETLPERGERVEEIVPKKNSSAKLITVIAVTVTVAVTAVLLYLLKKKKQ